MICMILFGKFSIFSYLFGRNFMVSSNNPQKCKCTAEKCAVCSTLQIKYVQNCQNICLYVNLI